MIIINESSISTKEDRQIIRSIVNEVPAKNGVNNSIGTYDSFIRRMVDNWAGTGHDRKFLFHVIEKSFHKFKSKKESKINIDKFELLESAINEALNSVKPNGKEIDLDELREDSDKYRDKYRNDHIEIYELSSSYRTVIHHGFGINWSALGTQPVSVAKNFVKALNAAIKDVEMLNKKYEGTEII